MVKIQSSDNTLVSSTPAVNSTKPIIKHFAKRTGLLQCIVLQLKSTISGLATVSYFFEFILCTLSSDHEEDGVSLSMVKRRSERTMKFYNIITNENGFFREEEVHCSSLKHETKIMGRSNGEGNAKLLRLQKRNSLTNKKLKKLEELEAQLPWHLSHLFEKLKVNLDDHNWYNKRPQSIAPIWLLNTTISHIGGDTFKIREVAHLLYNARKKFEPLMQNKSEILLQQTLPYVLKSGDKLIGVLHAIIQQLETYLAFLKNKKVSRATKTAISDKTRNVSHIMISVWRECAAIMPHDVRIAF